MQRAFYSLVTITLTFGLLAHMLHAESMREEAGVKAVLSEKCPLVWANPDRVDSLAPELLRTARQYCPEA